MDKHRQLDLIGNILDQTLAVLSHCKNPHATLIASHLAHCSECGHRCPGIARCMEESTGAAVEIGKGNKTASSSLPQMNTSLRALRALPPFSPVISKLLMNIANSDETSMREHAALIESDAAFTADLLQLANSASVACRYPVTAIFEAIAALGINRVASLAASLGVCKLVKTVSNLPAMRLCWRRNLATALVARDRAKSFGIHPDEGYMFGLLAGLGQLALLASQPAVYSELIERGLNEGVAMEVLESETFGLDNRQAGAWLVVEWQLPLELLTVLTPTNESRLGCLIEEASREATRLGFGIPPVAAVDPTASALLQIAERVNQIEQELGV